MNTHQRKEVYKVRKNGIIEKFSSDDRAGEIRQLVKLENGNIDEIRYVKTDAIWNGCSVFIEADFEEKLP